MRSAGRQFTTLARWWSAIERSAFVQWYKIKRYVRESVQCLTRPRNQFAPDNRNCKCYNAACSIHKYALSISFLQTLYSSESKLNDYFPLSNIRFGLLYKKPASLTYCIFLQYRHSHYCGNKVHYRVHTSRYWSISSSSKTFSPPSHPISFTCRYSNRVLVFRVVSSLKTYQPKFRTHFSLSHVSNYMFY